MNTQQVQIPEALGPGTEHGNGAVTYGDLTRPNVVIEPRRDPAEVARERAAAGRHCQRCAGIPDEVIGPLRKALEPLALKPGAPR